MKTLMDTITLNAISGPTISIELSTKDLLGRLYFELLAASLIKIAVCPTGSAITCDPPVTDSDINLVIFPEKIDSYPTVLLSAGFMRTSPEFEDTSGTIKALHSRYRRSFYNIVLVDNETAFKAWRNATAVCKIANLSVKERRIDLFKTIFEAAGLIEHVGSSEG